MDSTKFARLLVRLFSILIFAWTVATSPWIFTNYVVGMNEYKSFLYFFGTVFIPLFLPIITAIGLWFFAGSISGKLNPGDEHFLIDGFSEEKTYQFGLFFLGIFIALYAFVDLVSHIVFVYLQLTGGDYNVERITTYPDLIATFVEITLGLFIAFQRKGLMYFFQKLRS